MDEKIKEGRADEPKLEYAKASATAAPDGKLSEKQKGRILLFIIEDVLFALLGYLSATAALPFGALPFGVALLCAADMRAIPVFVGLCISALNEENSFIIIGIYGVALCLRLISTLLIDNKNTPKGKITSFKTLYFRESVSLKMAVAAISAFLLSSVEIFLSGFLYYDIFGMLISVVVAPISTFFLSYGFAEDGKLVGEALKRGEIYEKNVKQRDIQKAIGWVTIGLLSVFTLKGSAMYGISLSAFAAMVTTLFFSRTKGIIFGGIAGLLCGLVYMPALSPIFIFSAFASGVLFPISVSLAVWSSFVIGVAWGFYTQGISALSGLFPALVASALLFGVADRLFIAPKLKLKSENDAETKKSETELPHIVPLPDSILDEVRLDNSKQKIKSLCETLTALSDSFSVSGDTRFRGLSKDYEEICRRAFESSCASCANRGDCEKETAIGEESLGLSRILLRNRAVCMSDAGRRLSMNCQRLPDIIDEINHNASLAARRSYERDRSEIFALDYAAIANLLAEFQVDEGDEIKADKELGERLCQALSKATFSEGIKGAAVFGKRRKRVTIEGNGETLSKNLSEILELVEGTLDIKIDKKRARIRDGERCRLSFEEAEAISVSFAVKTSVAEDESEVCGDSVRCFFDNDGHFYSCISDGMGSGRRAAAVSEICAEFLEKMLSGFSAVSCRSPKAALDMLNGFLQSKNFGSENECSATVDLLELDTVRSQAYFCKCGAAPTYVFRENNLMKLRSGTMPIGIIDQVDCRVVKFGIDRGDLIIMMSDGVSQGKEECPWLYDLLCHTVSGDRLENIAQRIIRNARTFGSRDDISVCVIRVD